MSDDLIRKMCRAHLDASAGLEYPVDQVEITAMRAALLMLADNLSEDALTAMHEAWIEWDGQDIDRWNHCLKAAIRKAAE